MHSVTTYAESELTNFTGNPGINQLVKDFNIIELTVASIANIILSRCSSSQNCSDDQNQLKTIRFHFFPPWTVLCGAGSRVLIGSTRHGKGRRPLCVNDDELNTELHFRILCVHASVLFPFVMYLVGCVNLCKLVPSTNWCLTLEVSWWCLWLPVRICYAAWAKCLWFPVLEA